MAESLLGSEARPLRVAVVGSGPSAFYAVEALFKTPDLHVRADVFDRLPTPYGLVRGGVAPDHQKIKAVIRAYEKIAANSGFRFFGNVKLGRDLQVEDLTSLYDQIIYAFGNETDRKMSIPGEDLAGVHSATEFVGWYNGHPDFRDRGFDLENAHRVAVVGNGNVAMDTTRILAVDPARLSETDISENALESLERSRVTEVLLLGRRGPAQAAFSPKEIEEIAKLDNTDLVVTPDQAALDEISETWLESAPKSATRNVKFLASQAELGEGALERKVRCMFLVSPVEILGTDGRVSGIRLQKSELYVDEWGTPRPRGIDSFLELEVQLVFKAIGYRGVPVPGVPYDDKQGIVPNDGGRVLSTPGGEVVPDQYVVGWAKRGPTGLIGTNLADSKATADAMKADLVDRRAPALPSDDSHATGSLLESRGVDFVSYADWQALDQWEIEQGKARGKVRLKLNSVDELMNAVRELRTGRNA